MTVKVKYLSSLYNSLKSIEIGSHAAVGVVWYLKRWTKSEKILPYLTSKCFRTVFQGTKGVSAKISLDF